MKPRFLTLTALVAAAALSRIIPHPWNVTPIAAMALFAGAHFASRRSAYLIPLAAMAASNLLLGTFYDTILFVYASFALTVFIGTRIRERRDAASIAGASLVSSVAFFLITNAGHWLVSGMYPRTVGGFFACLSAGIPFFRNTVAGDLVFTAAFFGGFALLESRFPALRHSVLTRPFRLLPR